MTKKAQKLIGQLLALGFTRDEAVSLRRIQMVFHRWDEAGCGDGNNHSSWCLVRDDATGKPYMEVCPHHGKSYRWPVMDRERGAEKRLAVIMAAHPDFVAYHQTDCRGCALYIVAKKDLPTGCAIESYYSRGLAVCD